MEQVIEAVIAARVSTGAALSEQTLALVELLDRGQLVIDPIATGHVLAVALERMSPLAAVEVAATAATAARAEVRAAVAEALTWVFPLGCDDLVIDHLAADPSADVRLAAVRAASARRHRVGAAALERLLADDDPRVSSAAGFAVGGRVP